MPTAVFAYNPLSSKCPREKCFTSITYNLNNAIFFNDNLQIIVKEIYNTCWLKTCQITSLKLFDSFGLEKFFWEMQ